MACPESRLKCFLHYGCEERIYVPNRNIKYLFNPNNVKSVLELLASTETDKNVVSTIMKVIFCLLFTQVLHFFLVIMMLPQVSFYFSHSM